MNKKGIICLLFLAQLIGILFMNYLIEFQPDILHTLQQYFNLRDKLAYVNKNEVAIYLFFKRLKQLLLFGFLYIQISSVLTVIVSNMYLAFMQGFILSMVVYMNGTLNIIKGIVLILIPIYIKIIILFCLTFNKQNFANKIRNKKYIALLILIVYALIETWLEICINIEIFC